MRPIVSALAYCMVFLCGIYWYFDINHKASQAGIFENTDLSVYVRLPPSMEKLLSAAIAYLMILKSEVSFLSRARNLLTMWSAMEHLARPAARWPRWPITGNRSNGMEARNLSQRNEKLDIWVRISAWPWGIFLVHNPSHPAALEESRVEASIRSRRLASWQ